VPLGRSPYDYTAMQPSDDQRLYFRIVLEHFRRHGDWPILRDVQRKMVQETGRSVDVLEVLSKFPPDVHPFTSHLQNQAILNVPALALSGEAEQEQADFLVLLQLAVSKYLSVEERPKVSSQELAEVGAMDELRLRKVGALLRLEGLIIGGGSSSEAPYSWEYETSDFVHRFAGVETVQDYLDRRNRRMPEYTGTSHPADRHVPVEAEEEVALARLALDDLHPEILAAAGALFQDGHYPQAILDAFKAVEVRVREISRLDASGRDLMARAFAGEPPLVRVWLEPGQSGKDEQEGFKLIFMGATQGIRNPKAHDRVRQESPERALEYLAFASLLMRRLDDGLESG